MEGIECNDEKRGLLRIPDVKGPPLLLDESERCLGRVAGYIVSWWRRGELSRSWDKLAFRTRISSLKSAHVKIDTASRSNCQHFCRNWCDTPETTPSRAKCSDENTRGIRISRGESLAVCCCHIWPETSDEIQNWSSGVRTRLPNPGVYRTTLDAPRWDLLDIYRSGYTLYGI